MDMEAHKKLYKFNPVISRDYIKKKKRKNQQAYRAENRKKQNFGNKLNKSMPGMEDPGTVEQQDNTPKEKRNSVNPPTKAAPEIQKESPIEKRRTLEAVKYFWQQLKDETERLHALCVLWKAYMDEELYDMINVTTGQMRLLIKKFMQFSELIHRCEAHANGTAISDDGSESTKTITAVDLEGFWSRLKLEIFPKITMIRRTTELRHLETKQVHEISLILDENEGWKHIMSLIPKVFDSVACSDGNVDWDGLTDNVGYKYTNDQIRKIATPRQGDSRLPAEIFFDEWSTSGRKENRPTVGVFLQLLVKAQLFRAADYVAEKWLGENPPSRPNKGPAARVNTSLPSSFLNEVASYANDSAYQPDTDDLLANALMTNGKLDNNQDFYTKFRYEEKHWSSLDNTPPKPAPRKNRKSERMHSQEQENPNRQSINTETKVNTAEAIAAAGAGTATTASMNGSVNSELNKTTQIENGERRTEPTTETNDATQQLPLLPVFFSRLDSNESANTSTMQTESTSIGNYSVASLPLLSVLQETVKSDDASTTDIDNLPIISALNLNGSEEHEHDNAAVEEDGGDENNERHHTQENEQNGICLNDPEDEDDSNDDSKLGSSNNDSSLTNITGTSGENSFELSSRSTSNENIPVNVLQF